MSSQSDMMGAIDTDQACELVVERVASGRDAIVIGGRECVGQVLAAASVELSPQTRVLRVSAPPGGLTLSGVMAQVSGREDLGGHDDSVLEEVFRMLSGAGAPDGRSVLVVDACEGIHRTVLQYVHHVGRSLPGLRLVIGAESAAPVLEEGLAVRARLLQSAPILVSTPLAPRTAVQAGEPSWGEPEHRKRSRAARILPWAATGAGMAASLAIGLVVGRATDQGGGVSAVLNALPPIAQATVPAAPSAVIPPVALASAPAPELAAAAPAGLAPAPAAQVAQAAPAEQVARSLPATPVAAAVGPDVLAQDSAPAALPASRGTPVTIALMQEGGVEPGWTGPGRVLHEHAPAHRERASFGRPHDVTPREATSDAPYLSPDQVARVRRNFGRPPPWEEAPMEFEPPPDEPPYDPAYEPPY